MGEELDHDIPDNIDNCLNYCPRLENRYSGDNKAKVAAFCIKHHCPGPEVDERVASLRGLDGEERIEGIMVRICGSDPNARIYSESNPASYADEDEPQENLIMHINIDTCLVVRDLTQAEIRKELRYHRF